MRSRALWVTAVIFYGHAFWVCPLPGECPCRRGQSSPGHVRRVAWGYRVKPGGEPYLLVSGGGSSEGVIVGGDEVQQRSWSVEGCRAAVPKRAWYALVIVSDSWHIGLRGVLFGDGPGSMVPSDSADRLANRRFHAS